MEKSESPPAAEEAREVAEDKTPAQREHESEWSQGGQDVEEAEHDEPGSAA